MSGNRREEGKKKKTVHVADIEDWSPCNWKEVLERIRAMRAEKTAPVDTMGCNKCSDPNALKHVQRFHHLVALMLSSQTKDEITFAAMERLRGMPGGLTVDTILEASNEDLQNLIHPVGFYNSKTKYLKQTAAILKEKFDSDIPDTIKGMISLPGVGPKMAHLCMQAAWGVNSGIGVDTHVHRIANRLKWVPLPTKRPEQTQNYLEKWLPKEHWQEINYLLVGLGQTICRPKNPQCAKCLVNELCPSKKKH